MEIDQVASLYSNDYSIRLSAANSCSDNSHVESIKQLMPLFWYGSANAWLMFVGISPGGSPPKGKEDPELYHSEISYANPSNHFLNFADTNVFWKNLRKYTEMAFNGGLTLEQAARCTLFGNLVNDMVGDSRKLLSGPDGQKVLMEGVKKTLKVAELVKPKVIIALQKKVYELMLPELLNMPCKMVSDQQIIEVNSGTTRKVVYRVPVNFLESSDSHWGKFMFTRLPMHPSRGNFCTEDRMREEFFQVLAEKWKSMFGI